MYISFRMKSPSEVFEEIYKKNRWAANESVSGIGSSLAETEAIRKTIPKLLKDLEIDCLLDIPCGDFYWMREMDLDVDYIGGDIVSELVTENQRLYGRYGRRFETIDIINDSLPEADLLLCRDCLVHFSYQNIFKALRKIKASNCTYVLFTTFTKRDKNQDIPTGAWRPLNLQVEPFNFPPPILLLNEECKEADGEYMDKHLGLWKVDNLRIGND